MKEIRLTQDQITFVDDSDYEMLDTVKWQATFSKITQSFYATRSVRIGTRIKQVLMHRVIMDINDRHVRIDHINHHTLDNRRHNLRIATHQQNTWNRRKSKHNTSGITGVHWSKKYQKWVAHIGYNYDVIYLGQYVNIEDAICARKEAEQRLFGEFSYKEKES